MKVALIIAGGSGQRMNSEIPKQFIHVNNKPILLYTLEAFESHPQIDKIIIVCIPGWEDHLMSYIKKYELTKVINIVEGGSTGQESIRNGLVALSDYCTEEDIVIIHDGIRPLVDSSVLSDVIVKAERYGNAVTSMPYNEQIFIVNDDLKTTEKYIPREGIRRVSTPQAYKYDDVLKVYLDAFKTGKGIFGPTYANTLMVDYGYKLYLANGSDKNIKITTQADLDLFKVYLKGE